MAILFGAIYYSVYQTVMRNLDSDLSYEAHKHYGEIKVADESIQFINKAEWEEREHTEVQVNPVFIQLTDEHGTIMDRSPNLKGGTLPFNKTAVGGHFNATLNHRAVRQVQLPIEENGEVKGYILAALSSESEQSVILNLRNALIICYLTVLAGLYFFSRFLAGRSIRPVKEVSSTITKITKQNLKERVDLPLNKDEIYDLSTNFNDLLSRIENAIEKEKQFTSDASHELRTPLSTLRGTLEVLIRKPRTQADYEEKIRYSLQEIDRMTAILEQLLLLARLDSNPQKQSFIQLPAVITESLARFDKQIKSKNLTIQFHFDESKKLLTPNYYTSLIIDNLLSNAIKYSPDNSVIHIQAQEIDNKVICSIKDHGIGIKEADQSKIFHSFYRSESLQYKHIKGHGLGLSIVKKCAEAIKAELAVNSIIGKGTTISINFN
ncbi:HAMP domain-containing histidine kinase [Fulvivirga maritima]|uniref:sensor histidine kinase n=1 Tax=Fulvivirga maritima TaxID=2904247 RepID=UPI001F29FD70|nr:HAMP domain-containing sensor histidine kinase [Fulvivirga maritima]UII26022.1 HAMP domain-containing histidine kinase [Fulvivirga maritima]